MSVRKIMAVKSLLTLAQVRPGQEGGHSHRQQLRSGPNRERAGSDKRNPGINFINNYNILVKLGFIFEWNGQQKFSGSLSFLEQADKKSSGSLNEVDMF